MKRVKLDDLKDGDTIILDEGFTCSSPGNAVVKQDETGLFFQCKDGRHHLDGQVDADTGLLIGVYISESLAVEKGIS